ncbi:ets DNA-binding protein pokkuri isoform X3 [Periplaneta americana]|uniref:ets DNA-binding protein pokkuri isoform X3 n=1 Tax=Periplaneta americana TaxID=6978 RepID=UPI0037E7FFEA
MWLTEDLGSAYTGHPNARIQARRVMKLLPLSLPPVAAMDRLPLSLPFSPTDLLWRYPLGFPAAPSQPPPMSPLLDFKTHLPTSLASDPRVWSREDVATFLRWCEREFDLPHFDMEMFQMNGKAICLLTKGDLAERSPGAGDVLHNVLQLLVRDSQTLQRCLPSSPVTPTSRHHYPLSPHHITGTTTPTWNSMLTSTAIVASDFQTPSLSHLVHQGNSVTLSPAPSVDSQSGSPQHADHNATSSYHGGSNGSNQSSDSDEDSYQDSNSGSLTMANGGATTQHSQPPNGNSTSSPPSTPGVNAVMSQQPPHSPAKEQASPGTNFCTNGGGFRAVSAREFFPTETPEPNTNGRLLWDFLQQLLNDPTQRYTNYIAWKNRDTGVFKIVDPAGLAKLWGIQKNHLSMNYDKMSRALRYYYRVNILRKVQGERHCYQFLRNPSELKSIKNMSLLRQQMSPTRPVTSLQQQQQQHQQVTPPVAVSIKVEPDVEEGDAPIDEDLLPTDLSMEHPTDLSSSRHSTHEQLRSMHCPPEARDSTPQYNGVKIKSDSDSPDENK